MSKTWTQSELDALKVLEKRQMTVYQLYCDLKRAGWTRSYSSVEHKIRDLTINQELFPKVNRPQRIGYLDIETTNLNADFGYMLTWAIYDRDTGKVYHDSISRKEIFAYEFDKRIVQSLVDTLSEFDTVVTYYGTGFDIPFIRTRALKHKINFPVYDQLHHLDCYYLVKSKFKLRSNRLAVVTQFLGIEGKTNLDPDIWIRAALGDKKSLAYILDHNIKDTKILHDLHLEVETMQKGTIRSV